MPDQAEVIAQLTRRLDALEAEREVRNVVMRYSLAVDTNDADAVEALYSEDCVVSVDDKYFRRGREVRQLVLGEKHQSIVQYCSHMLAPVTVEVDADCTRAAATGYMIVVVRERGSESSYIWRQSYNRFDLEKRAGTWKIVKRISFLAGTPEAMNVLKRAMPESSGPK